MQKYLNRFQSKEVLVNVGCKFTKEKLEKKDAMLNVLVVCIKIIAFTSFKRPILK